MAHTLSFSKRINEKSLLLKRLLYDKNSIIDDKEKDVVHPLQESLDEDSARFFVYSDFYQRIKTTTTPLSLYIGPRIRSNQGDITSTESLIQQYNDDYESIKDSLDRLGIIHSAVSLYNPLVIESIYNLDKKLVEDHRVGLRSDVVYYDIHDGKVVPDHRIVTNLVETKEYIVRFFLNSNKETLSASLYHAYDIFGCVALLVNPHDKRYRKARGRDIILPITNRSVPVLPYEGVSIEGLGTRLLVPAHNREDFKIALELGLPLDVYAFDKFGKFTDYAKDFSEKSILDFSDNVIRFLEDISNLEITTTAQITEYRDKYTNNKIYPILEKNMYIGLGYQTTDDPNFIQGESVFIGDTQAFQEDIAREENFCISNQDNYQPSLGSFGGYFTDEINESSSDNLFQDIVRDFIARGLIQLPARGDDIIDVLSLQFDGNYLWKTFFDLRQKDSKYTSATEVYSLIERVTLAIPTDEDIDKLLEYIDLGGCFIHTKQGYIFQNNEKYHYDADYISLAFLVSQSFERSTSLILNEDLSTFYKYFIYLLYFFSKSPLLVHVYILQSVTIFGQQWDNNKNMSSDVVRALLLQSCHHAEHEEIEKKYTAEEFDRFINKRWNLCRIIPRPGEAIDLVALGKELVQGAAHMHDYDRYLISTVHELYDEIRFLIQKRYTDQMVSLVVSTLRDKIIDILIYIVKMKPSSLSEKVAFYVINFANHILYPLFPTTIVGLFENLGMQRLTTFFEKDPTFLVNKNIKCNFLIQFINNWYMVSQGPNPGKGFVLKANKDFLDYVREVLPDLHDFIGKEYTIELLDEHQDRPEEIEVHRVFAMQRGIIPSIVEAGVGVSSLQLQDSLGMLRKQLSYKEQLLQTIKNTLVRLRSLGKKEKLSHYQEQIEALEQEIAQIEYQISKLKYF